MKTFRKQDSTKFDLVARVLYDGAGSVPHDTDVSWALSHFAGEEVGEEDLVKVLQSDGETHVFFVRWEEPGEWSM